MKKLIFLLPLLALALSACNSSGKFTQGVDVASKPAGADVYLNGEMMGQTPMTLSLVADKTYEVKLVKDGYKEEVVSLASRKDNPEVKFGLLEDTGYYNTLIPSSIDAPLDPNFLPTHLGQSAYTDMAKNIAQADEMLKQGKISKEEHSYLMNRIVGFYSPKK